MMNGTSVRYKVFLTGRDWAVPEDSESLNSHGFRPDYDSGPHLTLMAAAVRLARQDMSNPLYLAECRSFLTGDLVTLFAECLGYEGSFLDARS